MSQCPEQGILQAYTDGELGRADKLKIENHLTMCPACHQMVTELVNENGWLVGLFGSENLALSFTANYSERVDIGVRWGWVMTWFMVLGLTLVLLSSSWLGNTVMGSWLMIDSPKLLWDMVCQQILIDGWRMLVTIGIPWLTTINVAQPFSWQVVLIGSSMVLTAIQLISRKLVSYEEVLS